MEKNLDWDLPALDQEEATLDPYSNTPPTVSLPDDVAQKRAVKAKIAFSGEEQAPSFEEILVDVKSNREDRLRERLAQSEAIRKMDIKQQLIREVVDSGEVTPETTTFLQSLSAEEIVGGEGILERKYAEWRMNLGLTADETGTVDSAINSNPDGVNERVDASVDRIYRKERASAIREEMDALYQQTGFMRTVIDFGADLIPGFTMMEDRGITPGNVNVDGLTPGQARQSQIRDLFVMPPKEFEATLARMRQDALDSGDYGPFIKFLDDVREYAAGDAEVDNAFALLSGVELVPGVGLFGDIGAGAARLGTRAAAQSIGRKEALRRAKEAIEGAASNPPTGQGAKAAGESPNPVSEAPASAPPQPAARRPSLREETVDPDGRRWPPAMSGPIDRTAVTGYEGMSDKALKERYDYINRKLYPDPYGGVGNNGLSVEEQNKLVDELAKIAPEYDKRSITPGNSLYIPEEAAGPSDRERITSIATTGKDPVRADDIPTLPVEPDEREVVLSAVAEKAAGNPKSLEDLAEELSGSFTVDGQVNLRPGLVQEYNAALLTREILDRRTGEAITAWGGDRYRITELTNEAMKAERGDGRSPLGFIRMEKNKDGYQDIYINTEKIKRAFETKWWTKDNKTGFRALPEDTFKSEEEFRAFVIEHEITHIFAEDFRPSKDQNVFGKILLEERVNFNALVKMGKKDAAKRAYPEFFSRKTAPGPDPDVVPAPLKIEEVVKPKSYPTRQSIDIPGTRLAYKNIKGKISSLEEEIKKTFPKGGTSTVPLDKGKRRVTLQAQLKEARLEERRLSRIMGSKAYKVASAALDESVKKIGLISDRLARPSSFYPEWFEKGKPVNHKAWQEKKASLERELKEEQARFKGFQTVKADMADGYHVTTEMPDPRTGDSFPVQVPATEENLTKIHIANVEAADMADNIDDMANTFAAHGDAERGAMAEAMNRFENETIKAGKASIEQQAKALARRLHAFMDFTGEVVGRAKHKAQYKLVNKLADQYEAVLKRQASVNEALMKAINTTETLGALRWSDEVWEAVKTEVRKQMDKYIGTPSSAILNIEIEYPREWQTGLGRTNQVVYKMGRPDGTFFSAIPQAENYARDFYGLSDGAFSVESKSPGAYIIRVAKYIDETDPNILKYAIQTDTKTPVSWVNTFIGWFRGSAGVSSEHLQKNLAVSTHHAKALHEAFAVAAQDIGTLSKKELTNLEALMEVKRDIEKVVVDPKTGKEVKVRGEWFENAQALENTYKKAFGEYPSENVVSAYFTMRQMYDFDLLYRNFKLFSEKVRLGIEKARLWYPQTNADGIVEWKQMGKGIEAKFVDEVPEGSHDVLIVNSESQTANLVNTAKSGLEGIRELQKQGYKVLQIANPDQRPFKALGVNDNYVQFVIAKDLERTPLTPDQLPATQGGHVRYREGFYVKQPRFEVTSNGEKLYLGDRSILGASSEAEAKRHAANLEIARQIMLRGDYAALKNHLDATLPYTVGEFENLFKPELGRTGEIVSEAALDKDTPITWVMDGQGVNDASKTHAAELRTSFEGVRDTLDDSTNLYGSLGKKYTGEKDFALSKIVRGEGDKLFKLDKARMISPLETLEQAWAEISRSMATDNMKIQAATNWVEEASVALETPLEELRRNPWAALNNPQWNRQYGDLAKIRTLDVQRQQIINFLGQRDALGTHLDWMRNKLMNAVFEKKGQAAADWVDDHVLPNVKNPLQFMRSFAFHTKMGFFNPIQLFLQSNTMINTWAITGNPARVGSAISGVMLMQMTRVNRNPEILKALGKKAEKLGWKPGEFEEMDEIFHRLSLHIVEGEVGTLDVMTNPKMFNGVGGAFLDKGLFFFREAERAIRMNAWAVAYKEYRDKFPQKVLDNSDINTILRRQEILSANMTRGSNALYQKGLTGPMTQFWGYQARIMEQLLGKQLTRAEKLRLMAAFGAMYGMPVSLGAATMFQIPGWSTDDLRQYALENNIDVNSGLASVAMNGLAAEMIRWGTSDENGQGGYLFAIGDRYGPGGLPVIKNLLEAKDGVFDAVIDLAFGASGSITRDFFKQVLPDNWDIIESASNAPDMSLQDFANMFSTISTVNNTTKLIWALNTHQAYTRDGLSLGDKDAISAWVSFTTGIDEQRFKDTFLKIKSMKDLRTANEELGKEYLKIVRQAKLLPVGSKERDHKLKKARALLIGMDPKDIRRLVKQAYKASDGLESSVDKNFKQKFGKE